MRCAMAQSHSDNILKLQLFAGAKSLLIAPMPGNGPMRGFIALWNKQIPGAFGKNQFLLATSVAGQLSESVENMRHRENEANRERLNRARVNDAL
jgi:GAF domain-containing protein